MAPVVTHITFGFPVKEEMALLEQSSVGNGFKFVALPNYWSRAHLFKIEKLDLLRKYLGLGFLAENDIVLFTDAYDVLVVASATQLAERFLISEHDIIFNAECNFWPPGDGRNEVRSQFERFESKWKYLNSGCFVGYVWAIKHMLDHCAQSAGNDDQAMIQDYFIANLNSRLIDLGLDITPSVFATLNGSVNDFVIRKQGICKRYSETPLIALHANGNKHNIDVLSRLDSYRKLVSPQLAVYVIYFDAGYGAYDSNTRKIASNKSITDDSVLLVGLTGKKTCGMTLSGRILTFLPDGSINGDTSSLGAWEWIYREDEYRSAHAISIKDYTLSSGAVAVDGLPIGEINEIVTRKVTEAEAKFVNKCAVR